jgi:hypothetical protein
VSIALQAFLPVGVYCVNSLHPHRCKEQARCRRTSWLCGNLVLRPQCTLPPHLKHVAPPL